MCGTDRISCNSADRSDVCDPGGACSGRPSAGATRSRPTSSRCLSTSSPRAIPVPPRPDEPDTERDPITPLIILRDALEETRQRLEQQITSWLTLLLPLALGVSVASSAAAVSPRSVQPIRRPWASPHPCCRYEVEGEDGFDQAGDAGGAASQLRANHQVLRVALVCSPRARTFTWELLWTCCPADRLPQRLREGTRTVPPALRYPPVGPARDVGVVGVDLNVHPVLALFPGKVRPIGGDPENPPTPRPSLRHRAETRELIAVQRYPVASAGLPAS